MYIGTTFSWVELVGLACGCALENGGFAAKGQEITERERSVWIRNDPGVRPFSAECGRSALGVQAGAIAAEACTEATQIHVVADHVDEAPTATVLSTGVLVLTLGDAHQVLDVKVG
jgi:hypothetical protein